MAEIDATSKNLNSNLPSWIAVTVKSAKERKDIVVEDNKTIAQFKRLVAQEMNVAKEQLCLVFHSSSLKDSITLRQCGISEGSVVRVVVKASAETAEGELNQNEQTNNFPSPFNLEAIGGIGGLVQMGFGSANFADVQRMMQRRLHSNPEMLKSLLDNPVVKDIMSKPDLYNHLIASNPFMNEIVEGNPDLSKVLGNSDLMKEMVSLAKQPALMKELIDPVYMDIIRPKNDRKEEEDDDDDDAPCAKRQKLARTGTENVKKVDAELTTKMEKIDEASQDHEKDPAETEKINEGLLSKGTENLLKEMINHSRDMASIMQAPYVQSAINFAANNPEYLRMMMNHIPGVDNSDNVKKQLDLALPYFVQQLSNPEVLSLASNPRALQAMLDVQEGMRELQEEVPGYFTSKSNTADGKKSNILSEVLSSVTNHLSDLPDEEKYATQLRHLYHMGFTDQEENLKVLSMAGGDINTAIIHFLQNQYHQQQGDEYQQVADDNYELHQVGQSHDLQQGNHLLLVEPTDIQGEHGSEIRDGDMSKVERLLLLEGEGLDSESGSSFALPLKSEH